MAICARFNHRVSRQSMRSGIYPSCDSEFQAILQEVSQLIHDARRADPVSDHHGYPYCAVAAVVTAYMKTIFVLIFRPSATFMNALHTMSQHAGMPDTDSTNFHRLSVAFGLSFDGLADFLTPDAIKPLDLPPG